MTATVRRYAEGTTVPPEKSRMEIEQVVRRYGATSFASGFDNGMSQAAIMFEASRRRVRFILPLPDDLEEFRFAGRRRRTDAQAEAACGAEERRRWRALFLAIKAKLEVVESGIATFEEEFAAHIVLPDGSTVGEHLLPAIEETYRTGVMPTMLGLPSET